MRSALVGGQARGGVACLVGASDGDPGRREDLGRGSLPAAEVQRDVEQVDRRVWIFRSRTEDVGTAERHSGNECDEPATMNGS